MAWALGATWGIIAFLGSLAVLTVFPLVSAWLVAQPWQVQWALVVGVLVGVITALKFAHGEGLVTWWDEFLEGLAEL